jgi:hypothetical protein
MPVIEQTRKRTSLPKMAAQSVLLVEPGGISTVRAVEGAPQGIAVFRDCDYVRVISHQAVGADSQVKAPAAFH